MRKFDYYCSLKMAEQSLKDKTVKGTFWSAADAFLGQGVTFIVGLILARLLSPEDYGLLGIVTIFTTILVGFVDCGFGNSLVRKKDVNDDDYNTMFYMNMLLSVIMYLLLFFASPYIASFFDRPQLVSLVRITGLILIIQAISYVQNVILSKRIDFKTKTKASLISAVVSGAIGIGMAFSGFGVWSLVGQQLSRQAIFTICMWLFIRWIPKRKFSTSSLHYMWGFGWKLMLSGFLDRLWNQLNQAVVGKFYSPSTLGQYTRSQEYANLFSSNLTQIIQRVSFPVLSEVQEDKERMVRGYRRIIKDTMFVSCIIMISMGAVAEPLIYCLIGPQWKEAATFLPFICIWMSLFPLHSINLNMLQVQGRTDVFLYLEIIKKIISIIPILLGIFVGIYWMLLCNIFVGFIAFFLNSYYTGKKLGYSSWMQLKDIAPSFGISLLIAISVFFLKFLPFSYWVILPIQVIVGAIVFFVICESTKNPEYVEIKGIVIRYCGRVISRNKLKNDL